MGSGPAGCVLANRLSENPNWKILLLEAGKPETIGHYIPSLAAYLQSTESNWNYLAERSNNFCLGTTLKPIPIKQILTFNAFAFFFSCSIA